jgi:integrase
MPGRNGDHRLDAIRSEDVQRLKTALASRAPKTVNNALTVLNTLLKKAVEWEVIDAMPCTIRLLPISRMSMAAYDSNEYERLVSVAQAIDWRTYLIVLLGGDAGLRCGEMIALEWGDVDITARQLCIQRSDWNGQVGTPKGGRLRRVPLTVRLAAALREHRHLRSSRVLSQDEGAPLTRQQLQYRVGRASRQAHVSSQGVHVLRHTFCSLLAMRGAAITAIQALAGHRDLSVTQRYMHLSPAALDASIRLLDASGSVGRGDILETGTGDDRKVNS